MPLEMLENQPTMGACDAHVAEWYPQINWSNVGITDEQIRAELSEYGAWEDSELTNFVKNRKRMLWLCAGNHQEEND